MSAQAIALADQVSAAVRRTNPVVASAEMAVRSASSGWYDPAACLPARAVVIHPLAESTTL